MGDTTASSLRERDSFVSVWCHGSLEVKDAQGWFFCCVYMLNASASREPCGKQPIDSWKEALGKVISFCREFPSTKAHSAKDAVTQHSERQCVLSSVLNRSSSLLETVLKDQIKRQPRITLKGISLRVYIYNEQMDGWPFNSTIIASHSIPNGGFWQPRTFAWSALNTSPLTPWDCWKIGGQLCVKITSRIGGDFPTASLCVLSFLVLELNRC